jgi:ComF family protein
VNIIRPLLCSFCDLLFPPLCLHCRGTILKEGSYLCNECTGLLQLINPSERCPRCFSLEYSQDQKHCAECQRNGSLLLHMAAAFDYVGPAASIVRKLKYGNQPYLANGAAGFMVAQFLELGWPMPDLIIPIPISFTHWLERGYNQSQLLADNIGALLGKPVVSALERKSGDYSQAGMDRQQRSSLTTSTLMLKDQIAIYDKRILLIDDVMTTGSTLERCTEVLADGCPAELYALTFCRAVY